MSTEKGFNITSIREMQINENDHEIALYTHWDGYCQENKIASVADTEKVTHLLIASDIIWYSCYRK